MADGDERTRTRRPAAASADPRDETGSTSRSTTRPLSTGRARAARTARPPDDPLARLQALHPTSRTSEPVLSEPVSSEPVSSEPVSSEPVLPEPVLSEPVSFRPVIPARNERARARAHRRGATSEVPATETAASEETAEAVEPATPTPRPATGGGIDLFGAVDVDVEVDHHRPPPRPSRPTARPGGLVLPVEPTPASPRVPLPTGRLPRIGEDRPSPVSDLPLRGIEPAVAEDPSGTILVPELDPSGEIVRDGTGVERRTLRDRIGPILVRRPRPRVRRVTRVVRHLDTWSVFKVALVFNLVLYVVCLTSGVLLWNVASTTGTIDNVEQFFEQFGWEHFEFHGGEIYHHAWIAGLFATIGLTGLAVLLATVFNLITDLVGGIRVSVLEEEVIERVPHRRRTRVARTSRPRRTIEPVTEPSAPRPIDRSTGEVPVIRPEL